MKIKLKEGVSPGDIPRVSGVHKRISATLSNNPSVEVEVLPKGLDKYVEEIKPSNKKDKIKDKGDE